ncbi:MAG: hypothetical protein E6Q83_13895 [Thiothrix sp.]|nr:MAG: hypothetical protein E6Q83_13895 [Thiothrix sp.]
MKKLFNILLLLLMIALGVGGFMLMKQTRAPLEHTPTAMPARPVEVEVVSLKAFSPQVMAYGNVEPAEVLQLRAQVSGKITSVHPELKKGGSIPAGAVVVVIDPEDYKTSLAQSQADLAASQSQLAQIEQEERNLQKSLDLARATLSNVQSQSTPVQRNTSHIQQNLNLAQQNLKLTQQNLTIAKREQARLQKLGQQRLIAQSQVDAQQQQVLQLEQQQVQQQQAIVQMQQQLTQQDQSLSRQDQSILQQQQQVTELEGQLRNFANRKANAEAQVSRVEQQVKNQKNTLGRTEIKMPFDARISSVEAKQGGFVSLGGLLFEADNTAGVEVRAEIPVNHMRGLFSSVAAESMDLTAANAANVLETLNLTATVQLVGGGDTQPWPARVVRLSEAVDPVKRTLGVVVAVDNPYQEVNLKTRPPLLKGMYVQVELAAPEQQALVIPRHAVHEGRVYLMNANDQLEIRPIQIAYEEGEAVVVASGLQVGERVVVNDLIPVIAGMPLKAIAPEDKAQP